jgi:hypothetical protein
VTRTRRGPAGESFPSLSDSTGRIDPTPSRAARRSTRLAWVGLTLITAGIITAILVRKPGAVQVLEETESPRSAVPAPPVIHEPPAASAVPRLPLSKTATADEFDAARVGGVAALDALAQKYPDDPAVLKALMVVHASDRGGYANALSIAKHLFELDPATKVDDDLRKTMLRIVNGPVEVAAVALDALATKMGPSGPDLLYEVSNEPSMGRFPRDRSGKLLETDEVRKIASPALLIAIALRAATPCKRKELFERAGTDGDARSLAFLKPLQVTNGCSKLVVRKIDCFPCLGNRISLTKAVKAIEARIDKP